MKARLARPHGSAGLLFSALAALAAFSCSDGDNGDGDNDGSSGRAGSNAGMASGDGGAEEPAGGRSVAGGGQGGGPARGGSPAMTGGTGGAATPAGGEASGGAPEPTPPAPRPDGKSAYTTECHGDSLDCNDPALRCLGLRDGNTVLGFACSNECQTVDDCSDAPTGVEAAAGCVDFALSKHCVLVCQDETGERACPTGMGCYVYPGAAIGYCLWRD